MPDLQERGTVVTSLNDRRAIPLVVALVVVLVDQITKSLALHLPNTRIEGLPAQGLHIVGPVYLELTFNRGVAFGVGSHVNPIVVAVVVIMIALLILGSRRLPEEIGRPGRVGLGMLLGGAIGNLCDRVFRDHNGGVIDFINILQVGHKEYWPVFNVADACITLGALILAASYASGWKGKASPGSGSSSEDQQADLP